MRSPEEWSLFTWLTLFVTSISSGIVGWWTTTKEKRGGPKMFIFVDFILDVFTSGFVCSVVFLILDSYEYPIGLTAGISGICGHMATRFLGITANIVESRLTKLAKDNDNNEHRRSTDK